MNSKKNIAFIGAGNMARAMIAGLLQNHFPASHIWASSPNMQQRDYFQKMKIHTTVNNGDAAEHADVIVFAVKPWMMETVCIELKEIIRRKNPLLISLVAGITTGAILQWIDHKAMPIVRTMPNIAVAVCAGVTGLFANAAVSVDQKTIAESLFRSVGATVWMETEDQLNVVTAVSGSGPAYLFYVFEAMQRAGESLGLSGEQVKILVAQTAMGAAKMVMETDQSFDQLRRLVTAEKGTTAAAISVLEKHKMQEAFKEAMQAALKRAKELSQ